MGVSQRSLIPLSSIACDDADFVYRMTRIMAESFRLHSQALVGYVADREASSNVSTPSMISQGADEDSVY